MSGATDALPVTSAVPQARPARARLRALLRNRSLMIGGTIVLLLVLMPCSPMC